MPPLGRTPQGDSRGRRSNSPHSRRGQQTRSSSSRRRRSTCRRSRRSRVGSKTLPLWGCRSNSRRAGSRRYWSRRSRREIRPHHIVDTPADRTPDEVLAGTDYCRRPHTGWGRHWLYRNSTWSAQPRGHSRSAVIPHAAAPHARGPSRVHQSQAPWQLLSPIALGCVSMPHVCTSLRGSA
jgi:hypothetical protein